MCYLGLYDWHLWLAHLKNDWWRNMNQLYWAMIFSFWLCSPFPSFDNRAISLKFCGRACLIRNGVIILPLPHIITTFASAVHSSSQQLHKLARARVAVICVPCRGWALIHSPWGFFRPIFPTNPGNKKTQKLLWKTNPVLGCPTWCLYLSRYH